MSFSNPLDTDRILSYYSEAMVIREGGMPSPRMALIYPTYLCNHKCPHCLYSGWNKKVHLPYRRFVGLIDELNDIGVKGIEFCGGGEPTLYPEFKNIIKKIRTKNLDFGILTNGSTLDRYGEFLVDNCVYVRVSLDSFNPITYRKMHGVSLGRLPLILKHLVEYRNKIGSPCKIGIKALLCQDNIGEYDAIVDAPNAIGVDYSQVKYARACRGELAQGKTVLKNRCWLSPIHTMIDAYGDVYVCCYYQYRKDRHVFGNIMDRTFYDVWFSDKHKEVIKRIIPDECNRYDCRFHKHNAFMEEVIDKNSIHVNFI